MPEHQIEEQPNNCEFTQNAKGDVSFKVRAYGKTLDVAVNDAWANLQKVKALLDPGTKG